MKERPILFSAPMVRAILASNKTQTRRIVKPQPHAGVRESPFVLSGIEDGHGRELKSPHGEPGDRLWVRETHAIVPRTAYAQSDGVQQVLRPDDDHDAAVFREGWTRSRPGRWRPSIHMPRWASRITLEITGVRVERLHDISEEDAHQEGIDNVLCAAAVGKSPLKMGMATQCGFAYLWETLNGIGAWDANPWVWVIAFKQAQE